MSMRVISKRPLRDFWTDHPEALPPLDRWFTIARRASWANFAEVRADFPQADVVGDYVVFNVGGNKYRLIAELDYGRGKLFVRDVLTHLDYDKDAWKS